jgi:hypothetical protein
VSEQVKHARTYQRYGTAHRKGKDSGLPFSNESGQAYGSWSRLEAGAICLNVINDGKAWIRLATATLVAMRTQHTTTRLSSPISQENSLIHFAVQFTKFLTIDIWAEMSDPSLGTPQMENRTKQRPTTRHKMGTFYP